MKHLPALLNCWRKGFWYVGFGRVFWKVFVRGVVGRVVVVAVVIAGAVADRGVFVL
jgi:hypothetical protein